MKKKKLKIVINSLGEFVVNPLNMKKLFFPSFEKPIIIRIPLNLNI